MGQSRVEDILENILGGDNELQEPQSRVEKLLQDIYESGSTGTVPIASETVAGKVKIGEGLAIADDGTVSVSYSNADTTSY